MKVQSVISLFAGVMLLTLSSFAKAEPVVLAAAEMDQVTAGASAIALAGALSVGDIFSTTAAVTSTATAPGFASAFATSGSIAASIFFAPAVATSTAVAIAQL